MTRLRVLKPEQRAQWLEVLEQSFQHDFYYYPAYHGLAEECGEGQAHLFVYSEGQYFIAIPLLLRPIAAVPGLAEIGAGWWDATSVYGYAGPIASHAEIPPAVLQQFQISLRAGLQERRVVSVFSRLHPLIPQRRLLTGLGEYRAIGQTVSIDLTLPVTVQRSHYRQNHKNGINKLQRLGVQCVHDHKNVFLSEFISIYYETMHRVGATDTYFFDHSYFEKCVCTPELGMHLFVCLLENKVTCGGLFSLCRNIAQYHLGGTQTAFLQVAPMKLLFDTVRLWASANGAHVLHLGGGVGSREDSLFHFKAGFSKRRHEFAVWYWTIVPDMYDRLCVEKAQWNKRNALKAVTSPYFPAYRCPSIPVQAAAE